MPIERIADWEMRLKRQDAFWNNEIIDRPVVNISFWKSKEEYPWPEPKEGSSIRDRWLDTELLAERTIAKMTNLEFFGDALPADCPNLGPEVFSSFFGCELAFSESTSWSIPMLEDWAKADEIEYSTEGFYWKKLEEITDAYLEAGKGRFYVGVTDIHPGGDCVAAFRDPLKFNMDMIEYPEEAKRLIDRVTKAYFRFFDYYYEKLVSNGQAISNWAGIVSTKKWYVPSNDFSCMVSKTMFDDIFLPGIIEECKHMEANIYHLDGPNALQHLDSLLEIKELNAIQWVYGSGNGRASDWMHVYKKCQAARKGLQLGLGLDEIDFFMENLRPEGLWIGVHGVENQEQAEAVIKKISTWK